MIHRPRHVCRGLLLCTSALFSPNVKDLIISHNGCFYPSQDPTTHLPIFPRINLLPVLSLVYLQRRFATISPDSGEAQCPNAPTASSSNSLEMTLSKDDLTFLLSRLPDSLASELCLAHPLNVRQLVAMCCTKDEKLDLCVSRPVSPISSQKLYWVCSNQRGEMGPCHNIWGAQVKGRVHYYHLSSGKNVTTEELRQQARWDSECTRCFPRPKPKSEFSDIDDNPKSPTGDTKRNTGSLSSGDKSPAEKQEHAEIENILIAKHPEIALQFDQYRNDESHLSNQGIRITSLPTPPRGSIKSKLSHKRDAVVAQVLRSLREDSDAQLWWNCGTCHRPWKEKVRHRVSTRNGCATCPSCMERHMFIASLRSRELSIDPQTKNKKDSNNKSNSPKDTTTLKDFPFLLVEVVLKVDSEMYVNLVHQASMASLARRQKKREAEENLSDEDVQQEVYGTLAAMGMDDDLVPESNVKETVQETLPSDTYQNFSYTLDPKRDLEEVFKDVPVDSSLPILWECSRCEHQYTTTLHERAINGTKCPGCCGGGGNFLTGGSDVRNLKASLVKTSKNLLISVRPDVASEISVDFKPSAIKQMTLLDATNVTFVCRKCQTMYQQILRDRCSEHGGCRECMNKWLAHSLQAPSNGRRIKFKETHSKDRRHYRRRLVFLNHRLKGPAALRDKQLHD